MRVLRRVPYGCERPVAEEACGRGEQEELVERALGDARDLAGKIDNALIARCHGENADVFGAPDCLEGAGFARLPINPYTAREVALAVSAPQSGGVASVRHLTAMPLVHEVLPVMDGVGERKQAVGPARVLDAVDEDGERERAGVALGGREVGDEVVVVDEV